MSETMMWPCQGKDLRAARFVGPGIMPAWTIVVRNGIGYAWVAADWLDEDSGNSDRWDETVAVFDENYDVPVVGAVTSRVRVGMLASTRQWPTKFSPNDWKQLLEQYGHEELERWE